MKPEFTKLTILLNVYEDGEKIGEVEVDIYDSEDIKEKLEEFFEMDEDTEWEVELNGDEIYIALSETQYFWNK